METFLQGSELAFQSTDQMAREYYHHLVDLQLLFYQHLLVAVDNFEFAELFEPLVSALHVRH